MADGAARSPAAPGGASLLDSLGEDVIRIASPVSVCMLLVVVLVSTLSSSPSPSPLSAAFSSSTSPSPAPSFWDELAGALLSSLAFVAAVTVLTFLLVLLFYLRCTRLLRSYLALSSFVVLALLGGEISLLLLSRFRLPLDAPSFALLLLNFSVVGVMAVFVPNMPISITQGFLVVIGVLTAYWFTLLPEWTTWALLIAMSVYDLAAVLLPGGPLRLLLELAISRNEEIPALVYEARPVEPPPRPRTRLWRERRDLDANSSYHSNGSGLTTSLPETNTMVVVESGVGSSEGPSISELITAPLIQQAEPPPPPPELPGDPDGEGIGLSSSGAIKLGLGDFIFYSVLVGRAAMYDYMTVYACYLAIMAGLGITLLLLSFLHKALPALPVSIALGIVFYLLTRALLEVFVVQCSTNLLMF